jgi:hypothetical protein
LERTGIHYNLKDTYLSITPDQQFFLELSTEEYLHCRGEELKRCPYNFLIKEVARQPTCSVGLFLDDKNVIKEKCDPIVKQFKIFSPLARVFSINNGSFLIASPDETWTQICEGTLPKTIKACSLCMIYLPCGCTLKSNHYNFTSFTSMPSTSRYYNDV